MIVDTERSFTANTLILLLMLSAAPAFAQGPGSVFKDCADCPEMVVIPAGTFLMGRKADPFSNQQQPPANEQPQHSVTLKSFALGKYEVTQEQWFALMGDNPSYNKGRTLPVENVSWNDIQAFIEKLNAKTGKRYRLPTEAEWEYAARAGGTGLYSFGDDTGQLGRYGWYVANASDKTHAVGEKLPNKFGLHDMNGNVWEWVQDCSTENYAGAPADGAAGSEKGDCDRVVRGGAWDSGADFLHSSFRGKVRPIYRVLNLGFRLARPVD
jgi:formylglycine-generating enzyme required for sulfatase activity